MRADDIKYRDINRESALYNGWTEVTEAELNGYTAVIAKNLWSDSDIHAITCYDPDGIGIEEASIGQDEQWGNGKASGVVGWDNALLVARMLLDQIA